MLSPLLRCRVKSGGRPSNFLDLWMLLGGSWCSFLLPSRLRASLVWPKPRLPSTRCGRLRQKHCRTQPGVESPLESTKCLKRFRRFLTPQNGLATGALVYVLCEVGPKPRLPSTRKCESVLPSTRRGGVWKNDVMVRVLGLVFEPPGPPRAALKMAST